MENESFQTDGVDLFEYIWIILNNYLYCMHFLLRKYLQIGKMSASPNQDSHKNKRCESICSKASSKSDLIYWLTYYTKHIIS